MSAATPHKATPPSAAAPSSEPHCEEIAEHEFVDGGLDGVFAVFQPDGESTDDGD